MVVGDESFADVSEGVFPLATAVEVLGKDVVGGEQAKDALEVLRVAAAVWTNGGEDLGGGVLQPPRQMVSGTFMLRTATRDIGTLIMCASSKMASLALF